jgi:hypothetical protein
VTLLDFFCLNGFRPATACKNTEARRMAFCEPVMCGIPTGAWKTGSLTSLSGGRYDPCIGGRIDVTCSIDGEL